MRISVANKLIITQILDQNQALKNCIFLIFFGGGRGLNLNLAYIMHCSYQLSLTHEDLFKRIYF